MHGHVNVMHHDMADIIYYLLQHIFHRRLREAREAAQEDENAQIEIADITVPMVYARMLNFGKPIPLKSLKAHNYGMLSSLFS